ncbi:MAG TPA: hypothetical protein DCY20_05685 [Firmicutes bacterium]|nr:hypothetical protein [Bacillota bacterium]
MDMLSELALDPQTHLITVPLLILVAMLRKTPAVPNWSVQWIILILAITFAMLQNGITMTAIYNGFIAAMSVTYITRGVVNFKEEKKMNQLQCDCEKYKELFDTLINEHNDE